MDSFTRFDLLVLNALDIPQVVRTTQAGDHSVARAVEQRAETLLRRVVEDTETPADIASLLHELARISYKSGLDEASSASWSRRAASSWGGLFFESRDPGGRRTARLADRLTWASRGLSAPPTGGTLARLRGRSQHVDESGTLAGAPEQKVLMLEATQALIDDLVERPLTAGTRFPLPRLSDLGRERGPRELNAVFSQIFPTDESGAFVLVDPRRYPGEPRIALHRPEDARPAGDGMFTLSVEAPVSPSATHPAESVASEPASPVRDPTHLWNDPAVKPADWAAVLAGLKVAGTRLGAPPAGDYRRMPGYVALRRWIVEEPEAGETFESVRWKDRPLGLILLARLVAQRSWEPTAATDSEYLEAELNQLVNGDPERAPPDGVWPIRPTSVVRRTAPAPGAVAYIIEEADPGSDRRAAPDPGPADAATPAAPEREGQPVTLSHQVL